MSPVGESSTSERRRSERVQLEAIVHYHMDGSEFINLSSNISSEGIFIKNFSPPPIGTLLKIKVRLPQEQGGVPVHLVGTVVRVADGVGIENRGMGVEFTSVEAKDEAAIRFFVRLVYGDNPPDGDPVHRNDENGVYRYSPTPADVLSLEIANQGRPNRLPELTVGKRQKVVWATLLILVGTLFGGGLVFLFFLAR